MTNPGLEEIKNMPAMGKELDFGLTIKEKFIQNKQSLAIP